MENHPIPQDITGFQFKLIGEMTIKQFAYLAVGVVLAWVTYILPVPKFISIPIAAVFAGLGTAMAFLPIEGRPFDVMIGNYFKALFSPTQYVYQKVGGHFWFPEINQTSKPATTPVSSGSSPDSSQKLKEFLKTLPQKPKNKLDEKEMNFLNSLGFSSAPQLIPSASSQSGYDKFISGNAQTVNAPLSQDNKTKDDDSDKELEKKEEKLEAELKEAKEEEKLQKSPVAYTQAHQKVLSLEKMLSDILSQKQNLENQILELKKNMEAKNEPTAAAQAVVSPQKQTPLQQNEPNDPDKKPGLAFVPDVPNLIIGALKGPRGNPLGNILVEVKDVSGNPVRAFKTNPQGQFASATPLADGEYTISFEDPKNENKFEALQIKAEGKIITPLEIVSIDQREELRRSLFTGTSQNP